MKERITLVDQSRGLGLEWRDPGPPPPRTTEWTPLLAMLKDRPGEWGMLKLYKSYQTAKTRANKLGEQHPEFEFCARPIDNLKLTGPGEVFG